MARKLRPHAITNLPATHTPGPWKTIKPGHGLKTEYLSVQVGSNEMYSTLEMLPADARLVAAAPDLLEAAKVALLWLASSVPNGVIPGPKPLQLLALAIEKAEPKA